jgi:hypothetical protein
MHYIGHPSETSLDSVESENCRSGAQDIAYFFTAKSTDPKKLRVCIVCEYVNSQLFNTQFDLTHCISCEYKALANKEEWPPSKKYSYMQTTLNAPLQSHLDRHHHTKYLHKAEKQGWTIQLVSQKDVLWKAIVGSCVPFSMDAVVEHLVKFIVANDQVRSLKFICVSSLTLSIPVSLHCQE